MKIKNQIYKPIIFPIKISNHHLKQSTLICSLLIQELMSKIFKHLPPDPQTLLKYSGVVLKQTTQKLVDVNMLESQIMQCQSDQQEIYSNKPKYQVQQYTSKNQKKSKKLINAETNSQFKNQFLQNKKGLQKYPLKKFKISKSFKLRQDEQIHLKKDGIKFVKKQQLKNLIKHRLSNSHSSLHLNPTCQKLITKHSLYQIQPNLQQKDEITQTNQITKNNEKNINIQKMPINKSTKSFSTLPVVNKNNGALGFNYQKQRISGIINQTQFVNLKDYYKQKQDTKKINPIRRLNSSISNPFQHFKNSPSNFSTFIQQNYANQTSSWLYERQNQHMDQDDMVINKLRQRKQKFYRTGINYSNGDSYVNTRRQNPLLSNANQKGNSQNNQVGAMIAFDYSGQILPTFKYDAMKMQAHYQDMEFSITQNDQSFAKKKQRKGHMFRGAINLKLVDHQRFIPHPNYKYEALVQKPGMLMRQNTAYVLKKGVEVRAKQQNTNNTNSIAQDNQQTRQRINRTAFQFMYNQEMQSNKVKYQDFIRFKKAAQSGSSSHKNASSRKKLHEMTNHQREESLLSKKSITLKGFKGRQNTQQDANNKVYKSQNRKALELLINATQFTSHEFDNPKSQKEGIQNQTTGGVLKKNSLHTHTKSLSNNGQKNNGQIVKKKVRIA